MIVERGFFMIQKKVFGVISSILVPALVYGLIVVMPAVMTGYAGKEADPETMVKRYTWYNPVPKDEQEFDEYFEKETGMKVVTVYTPWESIDTKIAIDMAADKAVDILYMNEEKYPVYPIKNIVMPLNDLIPKDDARWKNPYPTHNICRSTRPRRKRRIIAIKDRRRIFTESPMP